MARPRRFRSEGIEGRSRLRKGGKLLNQFRAKYGKEEKITVYPPNVGQFDSSHTVYSFKGGRWVGVDRTGEMGWDGNRNVFNLKRQK